MCRVVSPTVSQQASPGTADYGFAPSGLQAEIMTRLPLGPTRPAGKESKVNHMVIRISVGSALAAAGEACPGRRDALRPGAATPPPRWKWPAGSCNEPRATYMTKLNASAARTLASRSREGGGVVLQAAML